MLGSVILDIFLILLLVAYLVYGYWTGLVRSLSGILGVVIGGFIAVLLVPHISSWVQDPDLGTAITIAAVVALVVGGHWGGATVGNLLQRKMRGRGLRRVDRVLGAVVTTIVAALVASMLAASIGALGVPALSQAIASSRVLRAIDGVTPDPVQAFLAQVRSATVDESLPRIAEALGAHTESQNIPDVDTTTAPLLTASQSVVKITGTAYACGQSQSGSGFVVSNDRVITNAHVVAGVASPIVEVRNGPALQSTIVYFDPVGDLAVLKVPGLTLRSLPLTDTLPAGTHAVSDGYPYAGPFVSLPVGISQVSTINVDDIYGDSSAPRQVYTLAADVQEGDSGGPLLTTSGQVAGVIFAKGATTPNVGYAITMQSVWPVAQKAQQLNSAVYPGRCTKG
jgi:S1-C subfamily serine protease